MTAQPQPQATPPQAPRSAYSMGSASNMVRSLLVIGAMMAVLFFLVPRVNSISQPPVDVPAAARNVATSSGWAVSAAVGLPEGWTATSARYVRSTDGLMTWHAGYTAPGGHYVGVEQTKGSTFGWVEAQTNRAAKVGELSAAGRTWVKYSRDTKVQRSLLDRPTDPNALTTLITGDGTFEELQVLAEHLQVVTPK